MSLPALSSCSGVVKHLLTKLRLCFVFLSFLFACVAAAMRRDVRRSRFQVGHLEDGEPRPQARKLVFVSPYRLELPTVPVLLTGPAASSQCTARARLDCALGGDVRLREREDAHRAVCASRFVAVAESLRRDSEVLAAIPHLSGQDLCFLFMDREASTLSKHLSSWTRWLEFCRSIDVQAGKPSPAAVLDFARALSFGAASDRGRQRIARAKEIIGSLKFVASKLGLPVLDDSVRCPAVSAWLASGKWARASAREAVPLPLTVVVRLELALAASGDDFWLLGSMLLMIWGGLRWSDAQRLEFSTVSLEAESLRGWCWRTKTQVCGMPFGVSCRGVTGKMWGRLFGEQLLARAVQEPKRDFLVARCGQPMGYTSMLAQMRRCLCLHAGLTPTEAGLFTLHSCKATSLSWAQQLGLPLQLRAAQGHHRLPNEAVRKYGRDDVWPQLRAQHRILSAVARGWRPSVPLLRGLDSYPEDRKELESLLPGADFTDTESEGERSDNSVSQNTGSDTGSEDMADSDAESVNSSTSDCEKFQGPWLLNTRNGWVHKAVSRTTGGWALACKPWLQVSSWFELCQNDPRPAGYQPCGHSGCFAGCADD